MQSSQPRAPPYWPAPLCESNQIPIPCSNGSWTTGLGTPHTQRPLNGPNQHARRLLTQPCPLLPIQAINKACAHISPCSTSWPNGLPLVALQCSAPPVSRELWYKNISSLWQSFPGLSGFPDKRKHIRVGWGASAGWRFSCSLNQEGVIISEVGGRGDIVKA